MFKSAQETVSELWPSPLFEVLLSSPAYKYALLPLADPGMEVKELMQEVPSTCSLCWLCRTMNPQYLCKKDLFCRHY